MSNLLLSFITNGSDIVEFFSYVDEGEYELNMPLTTPILSKILKYLIKIVEIYTTIWMEPIALPPGCAVRTRPSPNPKPENPKTKREKPKRPEDRCQNFSRRHTTPWHRKGPRRQKRFPELIMF